MTKYSETTQDLLRSSERLGQDTQANWAAGVAKKTHPWLYFDFLAPIAGVAILLCLASDDEYWNSTYWDDSFETAQ